MTLLTNRDFCTALVLSLGHFLWQGTIVAVIVPLVARRCQTVHTRYQIFVAGLLVMASCLPITLLAISCSMTWRQASVSLPSLPPDSLRVDPGLAMSDELPEVSNRAFTSPQANDRERPTNSPTTANRRETSTPTATKFFGARSESVRTRLIQFVSTVYFIGVLLMLLKLTTGLWGGWRLRRSARPVADATLIAALSRQARILRLKSEPWVADCEQVTDPMGRI